jgi:hypothetical protein
MNDERVLVRIAQDAGELSELAARQLASALAAMTAVAVEVGRSAEIGSDEIVLADDASCARIEATPLAGDSFEIARAGERVVWIRGGTTRAVLHGVYGLLEQLGARFPAGCEPSFPRIERQRIFQIEPMRVAPAFGRRAFVSDLMTWNYSFEDRLRLHLAHDAQFIPWMARHGINAFSYIRHAHDTRLRIDELTTALAENGIASEYGGHVIQTLLPRALFERQPEYVPRASDQRRNARGNLCASNPEALEIVRHNAIEYVNHFPENRLLHVWGADVFHGAWCQCGQCARLSPQLQYMKVVNAIAESTSEETPVAYLAYHDTIEPDPALRPRTNVCFEWAPRERCYSHAIDDPACPTNPRYWESLQRYIELFKGRGNIFEYYADAILFGAMGFATPTVIASDLRAYHRLGLRSISNLTFGQFSTLAYPVNLTAFVKGTRSLDFGPVATIAEVANQRHPACGAAMAAAYREIERASRLVLTYADVMRPPQEPKAASAKRLELIEAARTIGRAVETLGEIAEAADSPLVKAERQLWQYSARTLEGIADYIAARAEDGAARGSTGAAAIRKIDEGLEYVRAMELEQKGTWGAYDLEWIHQIWIDGLRKGLE